jgi:pyroglutamyl-peptidase
LTTVLVTGFEPFGGHERNPSAEVARALDGRRLGEAAVRGLVLPVAFGRAEAALAEAIDRLRPARVLSLGLAPRRSEIGVERVAINLCDAPIPDNDGCCPDEGPLDPQGPAARFATLPVKAIAQALADAGLPATVSLSAGSYVCNALFYALLAQAERRGLPAGFLHLPPLAVLPLEDQARAVRIALGVVAPDGGRPGGAVD